ncbi:MAG TPA: hypothetical protein PKW80_15635 [Bacteroidales bacterium]|nr:hypothetical protein [Bacteroidales bacterium]
MKKQHYIKSDQDRPEDFSEDLKKICGSDDPFIIPEHYFTDLPYRIQKKISTNNEVKNKHHGYGKYIIYGTVAAALVILFVFAVLIPARTEKEVKANTGNTYDNIIVEYLSDKIDENTLIEMSSDNLSLVDREKIPDIAPADDHSPANNTEITDIQFDTSVNNEDIIEYFLSENIDPEIL